MKHIKFSRSPYSNKKVRVKNSYYTYSKEYPASKIVVSKKIRRGTKKRTALKATVAVLIFCAIFCLSYFCVSLGLDFSYKPLPLEPVADTSAAALAKAAFSESEPIHGIFMPFETIESENELDDFLKQAKRKNCNSIILDFKMPDGRLLYSSGNEIATLSRNGIFNNETVENAIKAIKAEKFKLIARIFCFSDKTACEYSSNLAVTYLDTSVLWLDKLSDSEGSPWLNPYSKKARSYLLDILKEVSELEADAFILENCSFPISDDLSTAHFSGEKSKSKRNELLRKFVKQCKKAVGENKCVFLSQSSTAHLNSSIDPYFGSMAGVGDGFCFNTLLMPEGYVIDKKSDYSSLLSLFGSLKKTVGQNDKAVFMIDDDEYTLKLKRTLENNGYSDFLIV